MVSVRSSASTGPFPSGSVAHPPPGCNRVASVVRLLAICKAWVVAVVPTLGTYVWHGVVIVVPCVV